MAEYRCSYLSWQAGTTTRLPVPRDVYEECELSFLTDFDKYIIKHKILQELTRNTDQNPRS